MYILIFDNGDYRDLRATMFADVVIEARTLYDCNYLIAAGGEIISSVNDGYYSFANEKMDFTDLDKDYSV